MQRYPKIQTLFKRDMANKGKMILNAWTTSELEYLSKNQWQFTEKVDGTNIRVGFNHPYRAAGSNWQKGVEFAGRTAEAELADYILDPLKETFTDELFKKNFSELVESSTPITLYGEGFGPKINKGSKYRDDHSFVLFDVKIGDLWLDHPNVEDIAAKLGIECVPVVGHGTLQDAIDIVSTGITFNEMGAVRRWGNGTLMSHWGNFDAEGIVARPVVQMFDRRGERIITKIKAVDFK
jgi:hypothetical protein